MDFLLHLQVDIPAPDMVIIFLHLSLWIHFTIPSMFTSSKTFSDGAGCSDVSWSPNFWAKYLLTESKSQSRNLELMLSAPGSFGGIVGGLSTGSSPTRKPLQNLPKILPVSTLFTKSYHYSSPAANLRTFCVK